MQERPFDSTACSALFAKILCALQFWELDNDHDFLISKEDLIRYGNHSLTYRIVERVFQQVSWHPHHALLLIPEALRSSTLHTLLTGHVLIHLCLRIKCRSTSPDCCSASSCAVVQVQHWHVQSGMPSECPLQNSRPSSGTSRAGSCARNTGTSVLLAWLLHF